MAKEKPISFTAEMIRAESKYKSILTKIDVLQATLNAKQSINRHLSHE